MLPTIGEDLVTYESVRVVESAVAAGVRFTVAKMSFARRADLDRKSVV